MMVKGGLELGIYPIRYFLGGGDVYHWGRPDWVGDWHSKWNSDTQLGVQMKKKKRGSNPHQKG